MSEDTDKNINKNHMKQQDMDYSSELIVAHQQNCTEKSNSINNKSDTYFKHAPTLQMPSSHHGTKQRPVHTPEAQESAINTSIAVSGQGMIANESEPNVQTVYGNPATERNIASPNTMQSIGNSQADLASEKAKPIPQVVCTESSSPVRINENQYTTQDDNGDDQSPKPRPSLNFNTYQLKEETSSNGKCGSAKLKSKRESSQLNSCEDLKIHLKPTANVTAMPKRTPSIRSLEKSGETSSGPNLVQKEAALLIQLKNVEEESGFLLNSPQTQKEAAYVLTEEQQIEHKRGQRKLLKSLMYGTGKRKSLAIKQQVLKQRMKTNRNYPEPEFPQVLMQTMQPRKETLPLDRNIEIVSNANMIQINNHNLSPFRTKDSDTFRGETAMLSNGFQSFRHSFSPTHEQKNPFAQVKESQHQVLSVDNHDVVLSEHSQIEPKSPKNTNDAVQFVSEDEFSNLDIGSASRLKSNVNSNENPTNHFNHTLASGELSMQLHLGGQNIGLSQPISPHSNEPQTEHLVSPTSDYQLQKATGLAPLDIVKVENDQGRILSEVDCTPNYVLEQHMVSKDSSSVNQVPYVSLIKAFSPSREPKEQINSILKSPTSLPNEQSYMFKSSFRQDPIRQPATSSAQNDNQVLAEFLTGHKKNFYDGREKQQISKAAIQQQRRRRRQQKSLDSSTGLIGVRNRLMQIMSQQPAGTSARYDETRQKQVMTQFSQLLTQKRGTPQLAMASHMEASDQRSVISSGFTAQKVIRHSDNLNDPAAKAISIEQKSTSVSAIRSRQQQDEVSVQPALPGRNLTVFRSSFQATRKSSLISGLVLSQKQIDYGADGAAAAGASTSMVATTAAPLAEKKSTSHAISRNRRYGSGTNSVVQHYRTSNLTASLQEEQIQLQKMLNPWSQVIGGQSRRYFKQRQQQPTTGGYSRSVAGTSNTAASVKQQPWQGKRSSIPSQVSTTAQQQQQMQQFSRQKTQTQSQKSPLSSSGRNLHSFGGKVESQSPVAQASKQHIRPQQRVQTAPHCQSPSTASGAFNMSSVNQPHRRRKTFLNVMQQKDYNAALAVTAGAAVNTSVVPSEDGGEVDVSQSHDYGTLGLVEDSQGVLRVAPSTTLPGRLLNGISASRRSQQANQTHVRYLKSSPNSVSNANNTLKTSATGSRLHHPQKQGNSQMKRLQSQVQRRRLANMMSSRIGADQVQVTDNAADAGANFTSIQEMGFFQGRCRPKTNENQSRPQRINQNQQFQQEMVGGARGSQDTFIVNDLINVNNQQNQVILDQDFDEENLNVNRGNVTHGKTSKDDLRMHSKSGNTNMSPSTANFNQKTCFQEKERLNRAKSSVQRTNTMLQRMKTNQVNGKQKDLKLIIVPKRLTSQDLGAATSNSNNKNNRISSNNVASQDRSHSMASNIKSRTSSISQFAANINKKSRNPRNKIDARQNTEEIMGNEESAMQPPENDYPMELEQSQAQNNSRLKAPQKPHTYTIQTKEVSCITPDTYLAKASREETGQVIQQGQTTENTDNGNIDTTYGSADKMRRNTNSRSKGTISPSVNLHNNQIKSSRMAENLLCSIKISSKNHHPKQEISQNVPGPLDLMTHQSPLPQKKAMPVSQFTFGNGKMQKMRNCSQVFSGNQTSKHHFSTFNGGFYQVGGGKLEGSASPKPGNIKQTKSKYPVTTFKTNLTSNQPFFRASVLPAPPISNEQRAQQLKSQTQPQQKYLQVSSAAANGAHMMPNVSNFNDSRMLQNNKGIVNMVNLRTPNVSHPSIQDEKSSAVNDLIPKYSNSSQQKWLMQQSPNFAVAHGGASLTSNERANVQTQTLKNSKKPAMVSHNVSLMKKKHMSTLDSPGRSMVIPRHPTQLSPSRATGDSQAMNLQQNDEASKKKFKSPARTSQLSKEFECDDQIGLFASDAQLNSDRSDLMHELTNLKLETTNPFDMRQEDKKDNEGFD